MIINKDFKEFIESLNANDVQYLIVGGYAVAFHGHPRYTKDIDIWIKLDPTNAEKIIHALKQFGFASLELTPEDFLVPDQIIQLGYPPHRIDLITTLIAVDFNECFDNRIETDIDGVTVNFIDVENLKRNKAASGRPQDIADVANLA